MMTKWVRQVCAALIGATGLAGCQTVNIRDQMNAMIGKSDLDILRTYGVPQHIFEVKEHTFYTYLNSYENYYPPVTPWGWGGWDGPWGWGASGGGYYTFTCRMTFEIYQGKVVNWNTKGNGC